MSNICDFDRILKTECNLQDEADAYLWRAGLLNLKEKGMAICYIINRCLVMILRGGKVNVCSINETLSLVSNGSETKNQKC